MFSWLVLVAGNVIEIASLCFIYNYIFWVSSTCASKSRRSTLWATNSAVRKQPLKCSLGPKGCILEVAYGSGDPSLSSIFGGINCLSPSLQRSEWSFLRTLAQVSTYPKPYPPNYRLPSRLRIEKHWTGLGSKHALYGLRIGKWAVLTLNTSVPETIYL